MRDTYGPAQWDAVAAEARLGFSENFEAMLGYYESDLTGAVIDRGRAAGSLDRPRESILEDLGTYLVSVTRMLEAAAAAVAVWRGDVSSIS